MRWRICTLARKPSCENAEVGGASRHIHEKLFEVTFEVSNAGWLRVTEAKSVKKEKSESKAPKTKSGAGTKRAGRLHLLWKRDVDRILLMVLTGDEEPPGQAWEFCALADGVCPQAVVVAQ